MNNFFVSRLTLVFAVVFLWGMVACSDDDTAGLSDVDAVAADKAALTIGYADGDSAGSVTQNVTLATAGSNGSSISWSSDRTSTVTTNGTVNRPAYNDGDATVTLTAVISKGSAAATNVFTLTVIKLAQSDQEAVTAAKDFVSVVYADGDSADSVTQNVVLNTAASNGCSVSWSSDQTGVIDNSGTVSRPTYGSGDATVVLTATISKGSASDTKQFTVTVKELPDPAAVTAVQTDKSSLTLVSGSTDPTGNFVFYQDKMAEVTQDLKNLKTAGANGTTITWSSGSPEIIGHDGSHKHASVSEETVIFTATISKDGYSETKDFTLTVMPGRIIDENTGSYPSTVQVGDDLVIAYKDSSGGITVKTYQTATDTLTTVGGGTISGSDSTPYSIYTAASSLSDIYVAALSSSPHSATIYHYDGSTWNTYTDVLTGLNSLKQIRCVDGKIYIPVVNSDKEAKIYSYDTSSGAVQVGSDINTMAGQCVTYVENADSIHAWYTKGTNLFGSYWNGTSWTTIVDDSDAIPGDYDMRIPAGYGSDVFVIVKTGSYDANLFRFTSDGTKTIYGGTAPLGSKLVGNSYGNPRSFCVTYDGTDLIQVGSSSQRIFRKLYDGNDWNDGNTYSSFSSTSPTSYNLIDSYVIGSYLYSVIGTQQGTKSLVIARQPK